LLEAKKTDTATLNPACSALVVLAEPEDAFVSYTSSMMVVFISQNVKPLEQAFGLKVGPPQACACKRSEMVCQKAK
jgi:hypothetical protein